MTEVGVEILDHPERSVNIKLSMAHLFKINRASIELFDVPFLEPATDSPSDTYSLLQELLGTEAPDEDDYVEELPEYAVGEPMPSLVLESTQVQFFTHV
jgi:hypothetical protein